jgi:hypothetical protein
MNSSLNDDFDFASWVSADGESTIRRAKNLSIAAVWRASLVEEIIAANHRDKG